MPWNTPAIARGRAGDRERAGVLDQPCSASAIAVAQPEPAPTTIWRSPPSGNPRQPCRRAAWRKRGAKRARDLALGAAAQCALDLGNRRDEARAPCARRSVAAVIGAAGARAL
jgi:hypothetical protein